MVEKFVSSLSVKAQNIVKKYMEQYEDLSFEVLYTDETKMISENGTYIICLDKKNTLDIEYRFMHEFFHCIQDKEGFPSLIPINNEYRDLAAELSSIILDLNIYKRLEEYEYYQTTKYEKELVRGDIQLLEIINKYHDKKELNSQEDFINLAGTIVTSDILKVDNSKMVNLIKQTRYKAINYYKTFKNILDKYDYNVPDDVFMIFKMLIVEFNLSSYVKVIGDRNIT